MSRFSDTQQMYNELWAQDTPDGMECYGHSAMLHNHTANNS